MLKTDDGRFAFRAAKNQHVAVVQSKGGLLVANQSEIRESDLFTLEEHKDSFVAFKSSNGKYISFGGKDRESLKANATSVGESELFRVLIMKDQVTITKTIEVSRSVTVNIGVHNYEEIAKHHKGWFLGTIFNWVSPDKTKQKIRSKIKEMLDEKLKLRIEAAINDALDAQLGQEVTKEILAELADQKIKAAVVTIVK
jgi:predicted DNA-binding transcriptional regulator